MNFQHMVLLIDAEFARVSGDARAIERFDAAIEVARANGYLHHAALAQERAASFCFQHGTEGLARHYLRECYHSNERWGALAVSRSLQDKYVQELAAISGSGAYSLAGRTSYPEPPDYRALLKSSQAISGEILLPRLLERLLRAILEHAGAQRGVLVLERRDHLFVEAEADIDKEGVEVMVHEPLEESERLALNVALYAARTQQPVVLADARSVVPFREDLYVIQKQPRSVLCAPILYQGRLLGLIYLENNRMSGVFNEARLEILTLLASQAAISIANARFHAVQIEAQQAKINPHFLFNALSSIANLAVSDGPRAEEAIVRLAHLVPVHLGQRRRPRCPAGAGAGDRPELPRARKAPLRTQADVHHRCERRHLAGDAPRAVDPTAGRKQHPARNRPQGWRRLGRCPCDCCRRQVLHRRPR